MINATLPKGHTAVMARRMEPMASLDDFPTPPWATRALCEHILDLRPIALGEASNVVVWEPAAGRSDMARPLQEYFSSVIGSDINDYGSGYEVRNFLDRQIPPETCDWIITNPPFKQAEAFALHALEIAREGVALFVRTQFLEGIGRFGRLFDQHPPTIVAPFTERVPIFKGRLDAKGSTATSYTWFVWRKEKPNSTRLIWIPPCRKKLEREGDYCVLPLMGA